jgi:hypothetical protein
LNFSGCAAIRAVFALVSALGINGGDVILQPFGKEQRLGAVQSGAMVHACIRHPSGVKVSNHDRLFTQPLAAGNSRWSCQLRLIYEICLSLFRSASRSTAVPEPRSLDSRIHL